MVLKCSHCGRRRATGYAFIGGRRFCHGDGEPSPTCYEQAQADQEKMEGYLQTNMKPRIYPRGHR